MRFETVEGDGEITVKLAGEIDLEWSSAVRDVLLDTLARTRMVRVDMAEVTIIDSSGVAALLEAFQSARKVGKDFSLANVGAPVMRVFKLARLDTVFVIE